MRYRGGDIPEGINVTPTHPLKEFAIFVGGSLLALALLFVAVGWFAGLLVVKLPVKYERRLGLWYGKVFDTHSDDPKIQRAEAYLQERVDALTKGIPGQPYPLTVTVNCSPQVNAFAVPGGGIIVLSGLLKKLKSEEELSMVLGHEIGHQMHRDHLRALGRSLALTVPMLLLGMTDQSGFTTTFVNRTAGLLMLRNSRQAEIEADDFGIERLKTIYPDPAPAIELFKVFATLQPGLVNKLPSWTMTHPQPEARYERLHQMLGVDDQKLPAGKPLPADLFKDLCSDVTATSF